MVWEFLAWQSSQNSTDVEGTDAESTDLSERDGTSLLINVADVEVPGIDGWKTDMELVFKKAFVISELLNVDGAEDGADGAEVARGGLGLGTKDW